MLLWLELQIVSRRNFSSAKIDLSQCRILLLRNVLTGKTSENYVSTYRFIVILVAALSGLLV